MQFERWNSTLYGTFAGDTVQVKSSRRLQDQNFPSHITRSPQSCSHYFLILVIAFNEKLLAIERKTKHEKKHVNSISMRFPATLGRSCELLQLHYCSATFGFKKLWNLFAEETVEVMACTRKCFNIAITISSRFDAQLNCKEENKWARIGKYFFDKFMRCKAINKELKFRFSRETRRATARKKGEREKWFTELSRRCDIEINGNWITHSFAT